MKATNPAGTVAVFTDTGSVDLPSNHGISLALKVNDADSSDKDGDGISSTGDVVVYTLIVNNTGGVDLTNVAVQAAALDGLVCQQFIFSSVGG